MWKKLDELKLHVPDAESDTHGIVINICSAMRRAGRTLGRPNVASLWETRLEASSKKLKDRMEFWDKDGMAPKDMEEGKLGVRKHSVDANSMWARMRNPWLSYPWAKRLAPPDPEKGSRYTTRG